MRLFFLRHFHTKIEKDKPASEWKLSAEGNRRMDEMFSSGVLEGFDKVFCSIEVKAVTTAVTMVQHYRIPYVLNSDLSEVNRDRGGFREDYLEAVEAYLQGRNPFWWEDHNHVKFRITRFLESLQNETGNILVITHGLWLTLLLSHYFDEDPYTFWKKLPMGHLVEVDYERLVETWRNNEARSIMLYMLANVIARMEKRPLLVAIDGKDAAGKTMITHELNTLLLERREQVITASVDGFHNPKEIRYRMGEDSPEGYYRDSFNYDLLRENLLEPLGPLGNRLIRVQMFNHHLDEPMIGPDIIAPDNTVLLVEGIFLLRPELINYWDLKIYLDVSDGEVLKRALVRDNWEPKETWRRYMTRYLPGQNLYHTEANPLAQADIIINNNDPGKPQILHLKPKYV
jgi:uridine kinase